MTNIRIKTAQNVEIEYELADLGIRIVAYLIDVFVMAVYVVIVMGAFIFIDDYVKTEESAFYVIFILLLPVLLYAPIVDSITKGQTLGKMALSIRVDKLNGNNAHFGHYFLRWLLLSLIDGSIIGVILIAATDNNQRVGDMLAGTVVIKTKSKINKSITQNQKRVENSYTPKYDKVILLSEEDIMAIKEVIDTNRSTPNSELVQRTATKLKGILQVESTLQSDIDFLEQVIKDYHFLVKKH